MKSIDENKTIGFTIRSEYLDFRECVSVRRLAKPFLASLFSLSLEEQRCLLTRNGTNAEDERGCRLFDEFALIDRGGGCTRFNGSIA